MIQQIVAYPDNGIFLRNENSFLTQQERTLTNHDEQSQAKPNRNWLQISLCSKQYDRE